MKIHDQAIQNVADTAFWIAWLRAQESRRPDALFHDPYAARLASGRGQDIAESMPQNANVAWIVTLRTRLIDDLIAAEIAAGTDTVLNLGAGLDSRPYRLDLPSSLRWIEADQAEVLTYKEGVLRGEVSRCRLESVALDLTAAVKLAALLDRACALSSRVLVLTEGVLPYLDLAQAGALAMALRARPSIQGWIVEYYSELMHKFRAGQQGMNRNMQNAPFKFHPADWFAFFAQAGWHPGEMRYYYDEARKHRRAAPMPLWRRLVIRLAARFGRAESREAIRKMHGFALLRPYSTGGISEGLNAQNYKTP